jgi:hypothetical protein
MLLHVDNESKSTEPSNGQTQSTAIAKLRDRALRLYVLGEWKLAAELYMESDKKVCRTEGEAAWLTV